MSNIRFLFDEDVPRSYQTALIRREPTIDAVRIGDPTAPPTGTKDPDLFIFM